MISNMCYQSKSRHTKNDANWEFDKNKKFMIRKFFFIVENAQKGEAAEEEEEGRKIINLLLSIDR